MGAIVTSAVAADLLRRKARVVAATLSDGLGKVASRFVADMVTGLLLSGSVRLSRITRALDEGIPEHSTHKRLSRNLGRADVGRAVGRNLLQAAARLVGPDTLLVVDTFELVKPYAEKMQYLATPTVSAALPQNASREGTGARGYDVCEIVAWDLGGGPMPGRDELARAMPPEQSGSAPRLSAWNDLTLYPVAQTLWSAEAPGFEGATEQIANLVRRVSSVLEGRGVFVCDAVPHEGLPDALADVPCDYIARVPTDFPLLHRRRKTTAGAVGVACSTPYGTTIFKDNEGRDEGVFVHFGAAPVRLVTRPEQPLWLVAVKSGLAVQEMESVFYWLTTEPMRSSREVLWRSVRAGLHFFDAISTNRDVKDRFDFNDVRVLSFRRLSNLATLVQAAAFVEAQWPGVPLHEWTWLEPRDRTHRADP